MAGHFSGFAFQGIAWIVFVCIIGVIFGAIGIAVAIFLVRKLWWYIRIRLLHLPVVTYPPEGVTIADDVHSSCTICITEYTAGNEVVILHCGHLFHPNCINEAVRTDPRCPMCRVSLLWYCDGCDGTHVFTVYIEDRYLYLWLCKLQLWWNKNFTLCNLEFWWNKYL